MSTPIPMTGVVATPASHPGSGATSPTRARQTRPHDDMDVDSDCDVDSGASSPHPPKIPRTRVDSDISTVPSTPGEAQNKESVTGSSKEDDGQANALAQALVEELECGMCAGVYIEPLALNGCGHVFCGSCVQQWIKSIPPYPPSVLPGDKMPEPVACPQCRHAPVQTATPSRVAKTMVKFLLERYPAAARPPNELKQAEEIYTAARGTLKFPIPPAPPRMNQSDYWSPCRWCYSEGEGAWRCPVPVPRFHVPAERPSCIRNDGLCPDGHRLCAGCERLAPVDSPNSGNCGICGEGFCGESNTGCECRPVSQAKPSNQYNALSYLLEDCSTDMLVLAFKDNWVEMCALGGYLASDVNAPNAEGIFKSILSWLRTPEAIETGGLLGLMTRAEINLRLRTGAANEMQHAIMPVEEGATEQTICSGCADEIFCSGILEWWARELRRPEVANKLPSHLQGRANCKYGTKCSRQENDRHARKYNHICKPLPAEEASKIIQDDSMPPVAEPVNTAIPSSSSSAPSEEESDDEEEEESDDNDENEEPHVVIQGVPRKTSADASTQYDDTPIGIEIVGHSSRLQPCWNVAPPAPSHQAHLQHHTTSPFTNMNMINPTLVQPFRFGHSASPPNLRLPPPQQYPGPSRAGPSSSPLGSYAPWNQYTRSRSPILSYSHASNSLDTSDQQSSSQLPKYSLPLMSKSSPLHPSYGMGFPTLDPWVPGSMNQD